MKIDEETIRNVARIARLKLSESDVSQFKDEFKQILELFSKIDKLDLDKEDAAIHPVPVDNKTRKDIVEKSNKDFFKNAQLKEKNYFKGPRIK